MSRLRGGIATHDQSASNRAANRADKIGLLSVELPKKDDEREELSVDTDAMQHWRAFRALYPYDPEWSAGLAHGYQPYHVHMSYEDYSDFGWEIAVTADGADVWPDAARIVDDGRSMTVTVLVRWPTRPL